MGKYKEKLTEAAGDHSFISVTGDRQVMIEGCRRILDCSDVLARVVTRQFIIEIWGSDLRLTGFSNSSVCVNGRITSLSLERKTKGAVK